MLQGDDIKRRKDKVGRWQKKKKNGYALCHCRLQLRIRGRRASAGEGRDTGPPRRRPPVLPRCVMRRQRSARAIRDAAAWALAEDSPTSHGRTGHRMAEQARCSRPSPAAVAVAVALVRAVSGGIAVFLQLSRRLPPPSPLA